MTADPLTWKGYVEYVRCLREIEIARPRHVVKGIKKGDLDAAVAAVVESEIKAGIVVLPRRVILDEVAAITAAEDDRLRHRHPELLQFVVGCLDGDTILGRADPIFNTVALCGKGIRKAWRNVTVDDLVNMMSQKTGHAAQAATAADAFTKLAGRIISAMGLAKVTRLEQIIPK